MERFNGRLIMKYYLKIFEDDLNRTSDRLNGFLFIKINK